MRVRSTTSSGLAIGRSPYSGVMSGYGATERVGPVKSGAESGAPAQRG